jgi:NAD(P)-dependent dehydrogenase (short-subunit alcohol dehydrogenase family)
LQVIAQMAAVDLGPYGITVNIIAMGVTDEGWIPRSLNVGSLTEVQRYIPLTRVGSIDDIGDVCCFLASDQARYITGAIIPVDGGYTLTKAGAGTPPRRE